MRNLVSLLAVTSLFSSAAFAEKRALDLGTLGGKKSVARDINESGAVVGESETSKGETHAFIWQDGVMQDLGAMKRKFSMANGLNNHGQVVGYTAADARHINETAKAVLWDRGQPVLLPTLRGHLHSQASEINDAEEIIGVSGLKAVVWRQRKPEALGTLGGKYSIALHINNDGWIVGNSETKSGDWHACLWRDGAIIDLGTLGGRFSNANAVNDQGHIVGTSQTSSGAIHTFLWENGRMHDLGPVMGRSLTSNGLLAGERSVGGQQYAFLKNSAGEDIALELPEFANYTTAFAVNSHGTVAGMSSFKDSATQAIVSHAVIWQ